MSITEQPPEQGEEAGRAQAGGGDVNPGSVGRVDWSPLTQLTGFRPGVSKYGLARYSPMEWRKAVDNTCGPIPSAAALNQQNKTLIMQASSACDQEQSENTLRLRQRAVDVTAKHVLVCHYCKELKEEAERLGRCKLRLRKALEYLGVVEGINAECREIRKGRLTEDLVRDEVEEELFQEKGLCQEIRQLYNEAFSEHERQYKAIKSCTKEAQILWSDQKETLEIESENIGLKNSSDQISFVPGIAIFEENMSTVETWEAYTDRMLMTMRKTLESSQTFRQKVHFPILTDAARDMKQQDEKILKAFHKRILEENCAKKKLEEELDEVLKEIAAAENLFTDLERLGRQLDFSLKVAQTRLENRRKRPGAELCRDPVQEGLMHEVKVINEKVTSLQTQMNRIKGAIEQLYVSRKRLERQIHVLKHSLHLDQERCMKFRLKFPNPAYLMGY